MTGDDQLTPLRIRQADNGDIREFAARHERRLDLGGRHLLAAGHDEVVQPAEDAQAAVGRRGPGHPTSTNAPRSSPGKYPLKTDSPRDPDDAIDNVDRSRGEADVPQPRLPARNCSGFSAATIAAVSVAP